MKIRFLKDRTLDNGNEVQVFKAGEVYDLKDSSAHRWLRRNVAELVKDEPKKAADDPPKRGKAKRETATRLPPENTGG